jgi:hypothetical protein
MLGCGCAVCSVHELSEMSLLIGMSCGICAFTTDEGAPLLQKQKVYVGMTLRRSHDHRTTLTDILSKKTVNCKLVLAIIG